MIRASVLRLVCAAVCATGAVLCSLGVSVADAERTSPVPHLISSGSPDVRAGTRLTLLVSWDRELPELRGAARPHDLLLDDTWRIGALTPPAGRAWRSSTFVLRWPRVTVPRWTMAGVHQIRVVRRGSGEQPAGRLDLFVHEPSPSEGTELVGWIPEPRIPLLVADDAVDLLSLAPVAPASAIRSMEAVETLVFRLRGLFRHRPDVMGVGDLAPLPARNSFEVTSFEVLGTREPHRVVLDARTDLGADGVAEVIGSAAALQTFLDRHFVGSAPDVDAVNWADEIAIAVTGSRGAADLAPVFVFTDAAGLLQVHARQLRVLPEEPDASRGLVIFTIPRPVDPAPRIALVLRTLTYPRLPLPATASRRALAEEVVRAGKFGSAPR